MQQREPFNEFWGQQGRVRCHPQIMAPVCLPHTFSVMPIKLCLGSRGSGASNSYLDHMQISDSLSTHQQAVSSVPAWDLDLLSKCRSHGKLLNFHEDKQDNGICSANWISTVWLLGEVCCLSWCSRGNTSHCIFPIITSCWSGKETCSTNRTSM